MAAPNSSLVLPAFAKLQGENFVYFMRKYSITLGRNTETSKVDWDLSELGGGSGPRVSRHHARIFYDFEKHHFALEVLGKNGCRIRRFSYLPGSDPVKLYSQDLIEIAGKQFYFLLPTRSFFGPPAPDAHVPLLPPQAHDNDTEDQQLLEEEGNVVSSLVDLISVICNPGEWVTMENLHLQILERFGENSLVRRFLSREDASISSTETEGRSWCSLLPLLRRHPEHFVMSTVTRGEVTSEYAALVSLVSLGHDEPLTLEPFSAC